MKKNSMKKIVFLLVVLFSLNISAQKLEKEFTQMSYVGDSGIEWVNSKTKVYSGTDSEGEYLIIKTKDDKFYVQSVSKVSETTDENGVTEIKWMGSNKKDNGTVVVNEYVNNTKYDYMIKVGYYKIVFKK